MRKLCWHDPHQLYQRLEAGVKELVLEWKLRLIELLQKQSKNPSLAQDFIQGKNYGIFVAVTVSSSNSLSDLLLGYERLCMAAQQVSPCLFELEVDHLMKFSFTWEVLNKHLYQSIIYTDPLMQNNIPIFISQVRT